MCFFKRKNIYLIKSFESDYHSMGTYPSQPALTHTGNYRINCFINNFKSIPIDIIYSSQSKNNVNASKMIAESLNLELSEKNILSDINYIDLGHWSGKSIQEIKKKYDDDFEGLMTKPNFNKRYIAGGKETLNDVKKRVNGGLKKVIEGTGANILILTHREVINLILLKVLVIPNEMIWKFSQDHGGVSLIKYDAEFGYSIGYINRIFV